MAFTSFTLSHGLKAGRISPWLSVTLGVWLVSQHGQSGITNTRFANDRGLECNLVYKIRGERAKIDGFLSFRF